MSLISQTPTWSSTDQVARPCSYETIPPVRLETSGGVMSTVDMVVQRRDGPSRLRDNDDDDDDDDDNDPVSLQYLTVCSQSAQSTP